MNRGTSVSLLVLLGLASVAGSASGLREPSSGPARVRQGDRPSITSEIRSSKPESPADAVTAHTILVNGETLRYRATAGYLPIQRDSGQLLANIFFVAYERLDGGQETVGAGPRARPKNQGSHRGLPLQNRPLTFAFNGGPGASSVWLHMGAFGPQRAILANDGTALPSSNELKDNESTWLEFTDLVFVDPVGTGFSRAAPGVDADQFYEVERDIETSADFIRLFVTQHQRWLSPVFLVGESYGTTRAAGLARRLQDRYALYPRGLILLSSALNMGVISFDAGNDLPYVLSLPSYAAVARYHGKLGERLSFDEERFVQSVQAWALSDYIAALAQGAMLSGAQSRRIAETLAEYTSLPEETIARNRLRVSPFAFAQELLSREGRVLGLLDGRVTTPGVPSARRTWTDPALFIVEGPFVATFNNYIRTDLGFQTDRPYIFLSDRANESWNWGPARRGYLNVAPILAEAMGLDNRLRVFAAAGYYDLATPWLSQEYVFNHLDLPADLRRNLTFHLYPTGHQIYTSPDSLRQLTADVKAFVAGPEAQ